MKNLFKDTIHCLKDEDFKCRPIYIYLFIFNLSCPEVVLPDIYKDTES